MRLEARRGVRAFVLSINRRKPELGWKKTVVKKSDEITTSLCELILT